MSTKIGIIICDRYRRCAGGKCLRALKKREGAFRRYADTEVELVGYTTCDGVLSSPSMANSVLSEDVRRFPRCPHQRPTIPPQSWAIVEMENKKPVHPCST